jgi:hypothetical protein
MLMTRFRSRTAKAGVAEAYITRVSPNHSPQLPSPVQTSKQH